MPGEAEAAKSGTQAGVVGAVEDEEANEARFESGKPLLQAGREAGTEISSGGDLLAATAQQAAPLPAALAKEGCPGEAETDEQRDAARLGNDGRIGGA